MQGQIDVERKKKKRQPWWDKDLESAKAIK